MYFLVKIKYPVKNDVSGVTKKESINMLTPGVNYSDAEAKATKELENMSISGYEIKGITQPKYDELHFRTQESVKDDDTYWWKTRMKYISENDNGKVETFYVNALVYAENISAAVKLAEEKMSGSMPGDVDVCSQTNINHVVFSSEVIVPNETLTETEEA